MSYKSNLKNIKAFVFDVDGVFTDGTVYLMPDKSMSRAMNVLDGYAVVKALKHHYKIGIITGGDDPGVRNRIHYLGITDYHSKISKKIEKFEEFRQKYGLQNEEILSMGDDLPDIEMMRTSGIACCPENAVPEVKQVADYISSVHGGKGAVRDVIEQVMKAQGKWMIDDTKSA